MFPVGESKPKRGELDVAQSFFDYSFRWDSVPDQRFVEAARSCDDGNDMTQDLLTVGVSQGRLDLYCEIQDNYGKKLTERRLFQMPLSPNLSKRAEQSVNRGLRYGELLENGVAAALLYPQALSIMAKVKQDKILSLREVGVLVKVAEAGEEAISNLLKDHSLASLLGTKAISDLSLEELAAVGTILPHIRRYWAKEAAFFAIQFYKKALPHIKAREGVLYGGGWLSGEFDGLSNGEGANVEFARRVVRQSAEVALQVALEKPDRSITQFVVLDIFQRPNPETKRVIEEIIAGYNKFPPDFRELADPYFVRDYNLAIAEDCFLNYFNINYIYADILAFLYREFHRLDAREALQNLIFQELSQGETHALSVYLKELVETDLDPAAIQQLKSLLMGVSKIPFARAQVAPGVLLGILTRDKSFEIFKPFLRGEESFVVDEKGRLVRKRFDIQSFARRDILPPHVFARNMGWKKEAVEDDFLQPYLDLVDKLSRRGFSEALKGHIDAFYASEDPDDKWYGVESRNLIRGILNTALGNPELRDFMLDYVERGNPFIGFHLLQYVLEDRVDQNEDLLNRLRRMPLDSIRRRLEVKAEEKYGTKEFSDSNLHDIVTIARRALVSGFKRAAELIEDGLTQGRPSYRHIYISTFYSLEEKEEGFPKLEDELAKIRRGNIQRIVDRLKRFDMSYLSDLVMALYNQGGEYMESNIQFLAFNSRPIFGALAGRFSNPTALRGRAGFVNYLKMYDSCDEESHWSSERHLVGNIVLEDVNWYANFYMGAMDAKLAPHEARNHLDQFVNFVREFGFGNSRIVPELVDMLGGVASRGFTPDSTRLLMDIANRNGYGKMRAIIQLSALARPDQPSVNRYEQKKIDRLLKRIDPRPIIEGKYCYTGAEQDRDRALRILLKAGNSYAYRFMRDAILDKIKHLAAHLKEATCLEELLKEFREIETDLMTIMAAAAEGGDSGRLAQDFMSDVSRILQENQSLIENTLSGLGRFRDDPLYQGTMGEMQKVYGDADISEEYRKFAGGELTVAGTFALNLLRERAKKNVLSYMQIALLAQSGIPHYSDKARWAMMKLPHNTPQRQAIFDTFARNQAAWMREHGGRKSGF